MKNLTEPLTNQKDLVSSSRPESCSVLFLRPLVRFSGFTFFLLLTFLLFTFSLSPFSNQAHASPPLMPEDPSSPEAYSEIKSFLQIHQGLPQALLLSRTESLIDDGRFVLETVQLELSGYPPIVLTLKKPAQREQGSAPLPAVVLFTGFQTGDQAVDLVEPSEQIIYVGFQYPWPLDFQAHNIRWDWRRMEVIPVMMAGALLWLSEHPELDRTKINVISVSFGTLFYPLAQRILNDLGIRPRSIVFGYGGVDLPLIIGTALRKHMGPNEVEFAKVLIRTQTWFVDPQYHLRHLDGPFLVVLGSEDPIFPMASQDGLIERLMEPKKIVYQSGGHINPTNKELIQNFMAEVMTFLTETGSL